MPNGKVQRKVRRDVATDDRKVLNSWCFLAVFKKVVRSVS